MKTPRILLFGVFVLFGTQAFAQLNLMNNTINGNPIVSSSMAPAGAGGLGIGAFATSNSCYWIDSAGKPHTFLGSDDSYVDIEFKSKGDSFQLLILQASGKVTLAKATKLKNGIITYTYNHFKNADSSFTSKSFNKVAGDDIYVQSTAGFYVTRDMGKSWQWDTTGLNGDHVRDFALDASQNVYVVGDKGLYKQGPSGTSWTKSSGFSGAAKIFIDRKGRMYAATNGFRGVYMSTDGGNNWAYDTAGLGNLFVNRFADDAAGNVYIIANNISNTYLFKSTNGTGTWTETDAGLFAVAGNNVRINTLFGSSSLWAGTSFGLFVSNDGGATWVDHNAGIVPDYATSLVKGNNNAVYVTTALGLYRLDGSGSSWSHLFPAAGYNNQLRIYSDNSGILYLQDPTIDTKLKATPMYKSTDNGKTWVVDTAGMSGAPGTVFLLDENGNQHLASSYYGNSFTTSIWKRKNGGSWVPDTMGIPALNYSYFSAMGTDLVGNIYASGFMSGSIKHNMMYRRDQGALAWVVDTAGLGSTSFSAMTAGGKSSVLAWNGSKIFQHTFSGWIAIPLPTSISFPTITALSVDANTVIFGAFKDLFNNSAGVYYSKDSGKTWTFAGLSKVSINKLASYGDTTYALTAGQWVYSLLAKPYTGVVENNMPEELSGEAYPNPAHDIINIRCQLANSHQATIEVYNCTGQKVIWQKVEITNNQALNISGLKPGIYIYKINDGNREFSGRFVKN